MVKKAKTKLKIKKPCKKLEDQIQRKRKMFLCKLQGLEEPNAKSLESNESGNARHPSSGRDSVFLYSNVHEDNMRDNYMCYRCKHFLELPRNLLSQPFSNREYAFIEQCKGELNFIRAIVWLKSSIACVSEIPVKQLQQVFNEQWYTHGEYNHCEDERIIDVEQLRSSIHKDLSSKNTSITSTPLNICNDTSQDTFVTPQRTIRYLHIRSKDPQSKPLNSTSANLNESMESLIFGNSNNYNIVAKEKEKNAKAYIIPESDAESILNDDTFYEHQPRFEVEKDTGCSMQTTSKNDIQRKNRKIENKSIFRKNRAPDVSSKHISLAKNQSIDPIFKHNYNGQFDERFSSRNQNDIVNKIDYTANKLEFDSSPKNVIITPRTLSQMSNVWNEYFEFSLDGNSPLQASNISTGNSRTQDSAYSTSCVDLFNSDIAAGTSSGNKRAPDIERNNELQPCKKKISTCEKGKLSSSIDTMLFGDSSQNFRTNKNIPQISNVYNCEFQKSPSLFSSDNERIDDTNSKKLKNVLAAESIIGNKCTTNIEHCELQRRNEKTVTRQNVASSPSVITKKAGISHTDIRHRYNLRSNSNSRKISCKKEVSFARKHRLKKCKSERKNVSKEENENKGEMISANWLNFTVESLRMERVILASIKVILSKLCDKRIVEVYIKRQQQKNTRNYWKGSLEEQAVKAVLDISDIFTIEEKPNICIKVIMIEIVKTLNEIMMWHEQLRGIYCTQTSMWIYRVQIILEFCNSLPMCVKVTDYLITKLKSLQLLLTEKKIKKNCVLIRQLHIVFYALNITLRKYRTIILSDQRYRLTEKVIPHVADLWKMYYIDKELKHADLDLDTAEKQWLNTLENSVEAFVNFGYVQFAKESFSLVHVLI